MTVNYLNLFSTSVTTGISTTIVVVDMIYARCQNISQIEMCLWFPQKCLHIKPQRKLKLAFQKCKLYIHSSKCSFKTAFFQTSIFQFCLLSPISALLLPTCSISSFQKLVEKVRKYIKEVWLILKKTMSLARWFSAFFVKKKCFAS